MKIKIIKTLNIKLEDTSWIEKEVEEGWIFSLQYLRAKNHAFYGRTEIKYVHELQNLYFALTGEELNPIC